MYPDFLLLNGKIWTGNPRNPWAEALSASDGKITAVGTSADLCAQQHPRTTVLDVAGKLVLPGFIDNHTHFMTGGFYLLSVNLREADSVAVLAARIEEKAKALAPGAWITGGGWNHELWSPSLLPDKTVIDDVTPRNPVYVTRMDLHLALVNSLALQLAGIDKNTPDPPGGSIMRDSAGEPTGILKDAAMDLVSAIIPKPSDHEYGLALCAAMKHAASYGITSVQDISTWEDWRTFRRFWENGWLTIRICARTPITDWETQFDLLLEQGAGDDWLRLGGVKGFIDGALGSGTALMFEPFLDEPDNTGLLFGQMFPEGIMKHRARQANMAGLPVSIHAIGDKANSLLLDMYEEIMAETASGPRGLRVEHAQHLRPQDIKRLGQLGLTVSMQPVHLLDDGIWAGRRLGPERSRYTFACRDLIDAGAIVSFGTDWPVAPLNPILGIYAAVSRQPAGLKIPWFPEQQVTVEEAVRAYTSTNAHAEFSEHCKGSLEPGKLADLTVLNQDIFTIETDAIPDTQVLYTVLNGRVLYKSADV